MLAFKDTATYYLAMSERQPPTDCKPNRDAITKGASYIGNTTVFLDEGDDGYEYQQEALNDALNDVREAFANRPENCQMRRSSDDYYDCDSCKFLINLD